MPQFRLCIAAVARQSARRLAATLTVLSLSATGLVLDGAGISHAALGGAALSGRVVDAGSNGLRDVCILLLDDRGVQTSSRTEGDGHWAVEVVPGRYGITFTDCGGRWLAGTYYDGATGTADTAAAKLITVTAGQQVEALDAALLPGAVIAGSVTVPGRQPVCASASSVSARSDVHFRGLGASGYLPEGGAYELGGVPAGTYVVRFDGCGQGDLVATYHPGTSDYASATRLTLGTGEQIAGLATTMGVGGRIGGTVTGSAGEPLPRVCVNAVDEDGRYLSGGRVTDDTGSFLVTGVPAGEQRVRFSDCSGAGLLAAWYGGSRDVEEALPVVVVAGTTTTGINATLRLGGALSGTVLDPAGAPLAGACLSAVGENGGFGYAEAGSDGRFALRSLQSDTYRVSAQDCYGRPPSGLALTYAPSTTRYADAARTVLTAPQQTSGITVRAVEGGRLTGRALTPEGTPLAGFCIGAYPTTGGASVQALTGPDGSFTAVGLPGGSYRGSITDCPGGDRLTAPLGTFNAPLTVEEGRTTATGDHVLALGGSIAGTVRDVRGAGIAQACVNTAGTFTFSDASGAYVAHAVPPGSSHVYASDCGPTDHLPANHLATVPVTRGERTSGIDVTLQDAGAVSGRLRHRPAPSCVGLYRGGSTNPNARAYLSSGSFRIGDVVPGAYAVGFDDCASPSTVRRWWPRAGTYESAHIVFVQAGQIEAGVDEDFALPTRDEPARAAELTVTPATGPAPLASRLEGRVTGGGNGPFSYVLDPGDGSPALRGQLATADDVATLQHTYTSDGTPTASLRVTTASGTLLVDTATVSVGARLPSAPRSPAATAGDAAITVTWDAPVDTGRPALDGYVVEASPSGTLAEVDAAARTATVRVPNGEPQTLVVRAVSAAGESPDSPAVTATALATTSTTLAVDPLSGDPLSPTRLVATVAHSDGALGTVTFSDGARTLATAPLGADGTATATVQLPPGRYTVVAGYGGSRTDRPSTSETVEVTRERYTTATTSTGDGTSVPADDLGSLDVTLTVPGLTGAVPTGQVDVLDGDTVVGTAALTRSAASVHLSSLAPGPHALTVAYRGDADHAPSSSAPVRITVLWPTSTTLSTDLERTVSGQGVTLTAAVVTADGGPTATGQVSFRAGDAELGQVALTGGTASLTLRDLGVGRHALTASYLAGATHDGSAARSLDHVVDKASTSLTVAVAPSSPTATDDVSARATVTTTRPGSGVPTGPVVFRLDGVVVATASLDGTGTATAPLGRLSAGPHALEASYDGDDRRTASLGNTRTDVAAVRGSVDVRVREDGGGALPGASVVVVLPDGRTLRATTDDTGTAHLPDVPDGSYTAYAVRSGYLPGKGRFTAVAGTADVTVALKAGTVATATVTSTRMTPAQMQAVGIDPDDPANRNTVEFTVNLALQTGVPSLQFSGYGGGSGGFRRCPTIEGVVVSCGGGGTATWSYGGYAWSASASDDGLVFLVIPGRASWLKEFFTVQMLVTNLADSDFTFTGGRATLGVPEGLVLAPTAQPQNASQALADIPGGESRSATWFVRGDAEGVYDLEASYAGRLQPFDSPVAVTARTATPLRVWGASALELHVDADETAVRHTPYRVRVALRNVSDAPVYNLDLELLTEGKEHFIFQPLQQLAVSTAELAPGAELAQEYVLLPDVTGRLDLSRSYAAAAGGATGFKTFIRSRDRVTSLEPVLEIAPGDRKVGLQWPVVPDASAYRVFATPADDVDFGNVPLPFTALPAAAGLVKGWVPASADSRAFYAVVPIVGGQPAMEQAMLQQTVTDKAPGLRMATVYRIPSGSSYTCGYDSDPGQALQQVPLELTFTDAFFGVVSYRLGVGGLSVPLSESTVGAGSTVAVPWTLGNVDKPVVVPVTFTNGAGDRNESSFSIDRRCLRENAVVVAMGLNSSFNGDPDSVTTSHPSPTCEGGKAESGVVDDDFSDQAATNSCTDQGNVVGNVVAHLRQRGYDPGRTRAAPARTLLEYSYEGASAACGSWRPDPDRRGRAPFFLPHRYSVEDTRLALVEDVAFDDTDAAESYYAALVSYRNCWRSFYGRDLQFSVVGHSLGGYSALALGRVAVARGDRGMFTSLITVDGAVQPYGVVRDFVMGRLAGCKSGLANDNDDLAQLGSRLQSLPAKVLDVAWSKAEAEETAYRIRSMQALDIRVATVTNRRDTCLRETTTINDAADETAVWDVHRDGWAGEDAHSALLHSQRSPVAAPGFPLASFLDKGWISRHGTFLPTPATTASATTRSSATGARWGSASGPAERTLLRSQSFAAGPAIVGRVLPAPGAVVTGGHVVAVSDAAQFTGDVSPDGTFSLAVPPGSYRVVVQPFGTRAAARWLGGTDAATATVFAVTDAPVTAPDVTVPPPVSTRVVVQLADGTPVPDAGVLAEDADGLTVAGTYTDADGRAVLRTLPGTLRVAAAGRSTTVAVSALEAERDGELVLTVRAASRVEARLVDPGGAGLPGVLVGVYLGDELVGAAFTDADGRVSVGGLAAGTYQVRYFEPLGRFTAPTRSYAAVAPARGAEPVPLTVDQAGAVVPPPGGTPTGGGGGSAPAPTPPASGLGSPGPVATTDPSPTPTPGGGGASDVRAVSLLLRKPVVTAGNTPLLTGTVRGSAGEAVGGVRVEVVAKGWGRTAYVPEGTATTAPDGTWSLRVRPLRQTQFRAVAAAVQSAPLTVVVNTRLDLSAPVHGAVVGTATHVVGRLAPGHAGVAVGVAQLLGRDPRTGAPRIRYLTQGRTDRAGAFTVAVRVPPGTGALLVYTSSHDGARGASRSVAVVTG